MRATGVGLPPPAYSMTVRWHDTLHERLPARAGKYVVMIDCGHGLCYLSTRSFNPFPVAGQSGWFGNTEEERVSHWLEGLKVPTELALESLALPETKGCAVCGLATPHEHTLGELEAYDKRNES